MIGIIGEIFINIALKLRVPYAIELVCSLVKDYGLVDFVVYINDKFSKFSEIFYDNSLLTDF